MSSTAIVVIAILVLVVLAAVVVVGSFRRSDARSATGFLARETRQRDKSSDAPSVGAVSAPTGKEVERAAGLARAATLVKAPPSAPVAYVPPDADQIGVTRRQFLNRANGILLGLGLSGFGAACLAFLWPQLKGGFGSKITIGKIEDINKAIIDGKGFYYVPEGRAWITAYPKDGLPAAKKIYPPPVYNGMEQGGIVALYQKCVHLGCRVPQCVSSQWFECPCHGSQYNRVGEKKGGPAPRGLDRFAVSVSNGVVTVDTGQITLGPPIGTNTSGQEAEGPHCVGGEAKH